MTDSIPVANVSTSAQVTAQRWRTRLWWLTALCLIMAVGITAASMRTTGEKIVVHFRDGHGIKPGDTLRYLGIDLGSVTEVHLASDRRGIDVHIQLMPEHKSIAVDGSRFWIERPRLRIGQVSGLETVIGAKYVGTIPGKADAPAQREFTGLDAPLGLADTDSIDIEVRFPAGEGLSVGDPVRYLSIDVGEVTMVELSEKLDAVRVGVRLVGAAQSLAREGTQFWIERPRLDISEVRGLETLVGGRYLAIEPSLSGAERATEFVGLPQAPPLARRVGSLELELEAHQRHGLVRSAPVTYRGLEIGRVADVGLAADGASVTVRVIIEPEYAELVRHNSVWWPVGGVRVDAGLSGVNVSVDSFSSWLRGGIAMATPQPPGNKVATGYRFGLADKPEPEWLTWQPRIATGNWAISNSAGGSESQVPLPRVVRAAISWHSSFLGFTRRQSAQTWGLPIEGDRLCVPASFIQAARAANGPVTLEVAGSSQEIKLENLSEQDGLYYLPLPAKVELEKWSSNRTATQPWSGKTTLIVINPELAEPMPLDASRAAPTASGVIQVNRGVAIHKSLEGSAVIEATTGELLGLLIGLNNRWEIRRVH